MHVEDVETRLTSISLVRIVILIESRMFKDMITVKGSDIDAISQSLYFFIQPSPFDR